MDDNKDYFGPLTGMVKPKFAIIDTALKASSYDNTSDLHIYVDLTGIIYKTFKHSKLITEMQYTDINDNNSLDIVMAADILKILSHWLLYLNKRNVNGKIVLMMNGYDLDEMVEHSVYNMYMKTHMSKMNNGSIAHKFWKSAISIVKQLIDYIPNCYLVDKCDFDVYVLPHLLDGNYGNCHTLIMSTEPIFSTYSMLPNHTVIISKIRKIGIIHQFDNVEIIQSLTHVNEPTMSAFVKNPVFYNTMMGIIGDENRGLMSIQIQISIITLATNLLRNIEKGIISESTQSVETMYPLMDKLCTDYIKKIYPLIDLEQHSLIVKPSTIENIKSNMIDLYELKNCPQIQLGDLNLMELVYI